MGLSIMINGKPGCQAFDYTLEILLNAFDELLNGGIKLFVEIGIKKFIGFNIFSISYLQLLRWNGLSERVITSKIYCPC